MIAWYIISCYLYTLHSEFFFVILQDFNFLCGQKIEKVGEQKDQGISLVVEDNFFFIGEQILLASWW